MSRTAREIVLQLEADSRALESAERRLTDLLIAIGRCLAASQAAALNEEAEGHHHTANVLAAHNDRIRLVVRCAVDPAQGTRDHIGGAVLSRQGQTTPPGASGDS